MPKVEAQSAAARQDGHTETFIQNIRALSTVNADYLDAAIKVINTQYGGVQDSLHDVVQLARNDLNNLKQLYLD